MPGGDRSGPRGMGPRTGRGAGYCAGYDVPGFANPVPGRAFGLGRGWGGFGGLGFGWGGGGRGWRHWYYATGLPGWARFSYGPPGPEVTPPAGELELDALRRQAEWLKDQLDAINRHIADVSKE